MRSAQAIGFTVVGLMLFAGCSAPTADTAAEPSVAASAPAEPIRSSIDVPITSGALDALPKLPTTPTRMAIPSLGIDMAVEAEGLDDNQQMGLPVSPQVAGWYKYGAGPDSSAGSTVIAAHVDSVSEGVGPFARLKDIDEGSEVTVTDEDGVLHTYRVVSVERIEKEVVPLDRVFTKEGDPHLVLVTCGGDYDYEYNGGIGRYVHNYIVTAEKVS